MNITLKCVIRGNIFVNILFNLCLRYTTIERTRPAVTPEVDVTTPEPGSNEVLPPQTRGGSR